MKCVTTGTFVDSVTDAAEESLYILCAMDLDSCLAALIADHYFRVECGFEVLIVAGQDSEQASSVMASAGAHESPPIVIILNLSCDLASIFPEWSSPVFYISRETPYRTAHEHFRRVVVDQSEMVSIRLLCTNCTTFVSHKAFCSGRGGLRMCFVALAARWISGALTAQEYGHLLKVLADLDTINQSRMRIETCSFPGLFLHDMSLQASLDHSFLFLGISSPVAVQNLRIRLHLTAQEWNTPFFLLSEVLQDSILKVLRNPSTLGLSSWVPFKYDYVLLSENASNADIAYILGSALTAVPEVEITNGTPIGSHALQVMNQTSRLFNCMHLANTWCRPMNRSSIATSVCVNSLSFAKDSYKRATAMCRLLAERPLRKSVPKFDANSNLNWDASSFVTLSHLPANSQPQSTLESSYLALSLNMVWQGHSRSKSLLLLQRIGDRYLLSFRRNAVKSEQLDQWLRHIAQYEQAFQHFFTVLVPSTVVAHLISMLTVHRQTTAKRRKTNPGEPPVLADPPPE